MNVFNKVTLESLKKNRTRTIVTIIGIMLSAAMICASTTLVSSMQNFVLRCAIHIDGDWYGAVYDAAYKDYEDIRDSDRVSSAAYAQVLGYAKIDSANERKPYLYVLGGDVASGYFKTMPVHLILGTLPKDSTEIILPEHLTSNGKVNYKLGDTVTLDVGDRTLDGRRLGQDTPVYTYDSETQVEIMSGERLENTEARTYTVVGIYERPTFEDNSAPGYTALTTADPKAADQSSIHCYFKLHKPAGVYDFMKEMGYTLETEEDAKEFLARKGYDIQYGARPLKRALQTYLEDAICELVINDELQEGEILTVRAAEGDKLRITHGLAQE